MTQVFSKPIDNTPRRQIGHEQLAFEGHSATNALANPVPCALCIDAASKPIPRYEPNVSSLTGRAPHPTDLMKPDILGEFFCVTAVRQVGIVSNQATANEYMDVEGSSGQRFPGWEEARAYYTAHYHRGCIHIIPPTFPPRVPTPPPNSGPKKKSKTVKSPKTVKSTTPSTRHRRRDSSSSSGHNYRSLYEDDDPIPPVIVSHLLPATAAAVVNQAPPFPDGLSPGTVGNPIEVTSNFPTPVTNQETPKRRKKAQRLGLGSAAPVSPTPASASLPTILTQVSESRKQPPHISNGPDRFVYVCDCSDEEGGYSAPRVPSLKCKALDHTSASGSKTQSNEVIEIHTDSDTDSEIRPVTKPRFCKCASLKSFLSSRADGADGPDLNCDHTNVDMDTTPEIPRPSPSAQV